MAAGKRTSAIAILAVPAALGAALAMTIPPATAAPAAARASWPQFGLNAARDNYNKLEKILGPRDVHALRRRWGSAEHGGTTTNSPPSLADGIVYLGTQAGVYARDASTGKLRWHTRIGLDFDSAPAVADGIVYAGGYQYKSEIDGYLYAISAASGRKLWRFDTGNAITVPQSPAVANGVVYVSNNTTLYALNAATGSQLWSFAGPAEGELGNIAVSGGVVYLTVEGGLDALNAGTGDVLWHAPIPGDDVLGTPMVAGGVVYVGSNLVLYAISASSGSQRWLHYFSGATGLSFLETAAAKGVIYVGTYNNMSNRTQLYALKASADGRRLWHFRSGFNNSPPQPVVANGVVYINIGGTLTAVRASDGRKLRSMPTTFGSAPPIVVNGTVYVGGTTNVDAFGLPRR
jgi:outer membrane protein assembly factor BamB